ncbi:hypothetical protein DPMN_187240 [Dreissena polymorpha]|uniref:Uncharacterized protein n=1 Tax=Dreissena polymorpha TaxID=45954 RepID=A0A9D4I8W3_DREPO|nr:hypothetical protein DPMN_187240 [Dreissena polymorpha]
MAAKTKHSAAPGGHVFQPTGTIFKLFHDDRTINVASRVLKRKNTTPLGGHVFSPTGIISEFIQDINGTNRLTKFHDDRTIHVTSIVLISHIKKIAPPPGGHVFKATETVFELIQDIIRTNLPTKFHKDRKINVAYRVFTSFHYSHIRKNAPPPGGHVFQPTVIIIIRMNLLTKFNEDLTINVASRVKNAQPTGGHVFQANVTIFELMQDIIKTNLPT